MDGAVALARTDLACFCAMSYPRFELAHHHRLIVDKLEAIERGEIDRLMVFLPPRHGKSLIGSTLFPAWFLGRHPEWSIIASSYGAELATDFGRRVRNLVSDGLFQSIFPAAKLAGDSTAAHRFSLSKGGNYYAVGAGGPITGRGADLLLIDDPIKGREDANSESYRRQLHEWYESVAYTRLQPEGAVVIISTRWHMDDLAGWLLREHPEENWSVLNLPAIAEQDEGWRREGDALWEKKFPLKRLAQIREAVGGSAWAALYQQRPAAAEGAIFKREWWKYHTPATLPERFEQVVISLDTAFKAGASNDYSVGLVLGVGEVGYYVLDVWRDRVEFPALLRAVEMLALKWRPDRVLIEDKASGQSLIQELQTSSRLAIEPVKVDSDKVTRATACTPLVEAGRVFLPEDADWLADFLEEVSSFPSAPHDDCVDALSQALNYVRESSSGIFEYVKDLAMSIARGEKPERDETMSNIYLEAQEELRAISNSCAVCGRPVVGTGVDELGKRFHRECYAAKSQNGHTETPDNEARDIAPLWADSAPTKPRVCEFCTLPIYGTATQIGAKRWHPDCFR
ncbi:phage terminase large subunit [Candidatus Binatus sp.]|uniref:phage terminase large subunit n=1 Tax=Candidatus Binatus sp. TaxID=2811406 RepID=UPI002FD9D554